MNEAISLRVDHESGMIGYFKGEVEVSSCHIEQVGLGDDTLEEYVIKAGGIRRAIAQMPLSNIYVNTYLNN